MTKKSKAKLNKVIVKLGQVENCLRLLINGCNDGSELNIYVTLRSKLNCMSLRLKNYIFRHADMNNFNFHS